MNYLETLKNITKNKEKRVENLILLVVLLVIILVASKFIFSSNDTKSNNTSNTSNIDSNKKDINNEAQSDSLKSTQTDLESKLGNILSQISGISEVSVVITYSEESKQNPIYNTKEQEKSGEKTTEKSVAYNEESGKKTAIIESIETPKIEGAIVVAKGASSVDIRSKIASAVATVTSVPVYKIQVFEKEG